MNDFVVWNPWSENAKKMSDFGDDEYPGMICVEAVHTSQPIVVKQGQKWSANHTIKVLD